MPNCFKCGEAITFNKNVLSKTGKQIPLWIDQQNTHGHDEDGNPTRGPLPVASETTTPRSVPTQKVAQVQQKPIQFTEETTQGGLPGPTDKPTLEAILLNQINGLVSQANTAISILTKEVIDMKKVINLIYEKIEYNTQVDTDKLIGQQQQIFDAITFLKTNFKIGTEILEDNKKQREEEEERKRQAKYKKEVEEQKRWNNKKPKVDEEDGNDDNPVDDDDDEEVVTAEEEEVL